MGTRRRQKKKRIRESRLLADEFARRLQSLERTRTKAESLYLGGHFGDRDVGYIYEAIFLSLMTRFESLLEELFFALLVGRMASTSRRTRSKISAQSESVVRDILLSGGMTILYGYLIVERRTELVPISPADFHSHHWMMVKNRFFASLCSYEMQ